MSNEDADRSFARQVKHIREGLKMSQAELSHELAQYGVNFQATTIYKIEQGKRKVTIAEAVALAHALRVSLLELIGQGVDSAFVAKEFLLTNGMEILFTHEKLLEFMQIMVERQQAIVTLLADYRDRTGEDPLWLEYAPGKQDLRQHWEPLATWDGPAEYLASWRALDEATGRRYTRDSLGWADDWTEAVDNPSE
jgi:transcriptional regulator with XRE-family HTH domain